MGKFVTVNTSDVALILEPREAYRRQLSIGTSWTEVLLGMFYTFVPYGNDDAAAVAEGPLAYGLPGDYFYFGLKDSSATSPLVSGSYFNGICDNWDLVIESNASGTGNWGRYIGSPAVNVMATNGTTLVHRDGGASARPQLPQYSSGNCAGFLGIRLLVTNFGLSSQTVAVSVNASSTTAETNVSAAALRTRLTGATYSSASNSSFTWASGGTALTLPDTFFVHSPFFENRLRISAHGVVRIS